MKIKLSDLKRLVEVSVKRPPSMMKRVVDAITKLGFVVKERRKNGGTKRVWFSKKKSFNQEMMPSEMFQVLQDALESDGLPVTFKRPSGFRNEVTSETTLESDAFTIAFPDDPEVSSIGADALLTVFVGRHADEERSGVDTDLY